MTAKNTISDTFTLTIKYECAVDSLTLGSSDTDIGDTTIITGGSNSVKTIDFTQSVSSCALVYGLQLLNENTDTWDTYSSEAWV